MSKFEIEMNVLHENVAEEGESEGRCREHPTSRLTCSVITVFRKSPISSRPLPACAFCGSASSVHRVMGLFQ